MSVITFGSFAADMTSDELTTPGFTDFFPKFAAGNVSPADIISVSPTQIVARDPISLSVLIVRGSFNPTSEAALLASRVTSVRAETSTAQLIFEASGFSLSLQQILTLTLGEIADLIVGGSDVITGSTLNDTLLGFGGNDQIDGSTGMDRMEGGPGNDTYIADNASDTAVELPGQGIDTVRSSVSFLLRANVENLVLLGTAAISGVGNELDNFINGALNPAANILTGSIGNDTYEVGDNDTVLEFPGGGIDTVRTAAMNAVLPANVENLVLLGTGDTVGKGNQLPNTLNGTEGDNTLDGGRGPDVLAGLAGDDTYLVDSGVDVVTEGGGGGIDEIVSLVALTLPANVENATAAPGTSVVALTGNGLGNVLTGNDGANLLDGVAGNDTLLGLGGLDILLGGDGNDLLAGGLGIDVLHGGPGADRFRFDAAPSGTNFDRIMDFAPGTDDLEFSAALFAGLGVVGGAVDPNDFVKGPGAVALDPEDRLLYDTSTGRLYYDGDGSGAGNPEAIALLQGAPNLGAGDLHVVA
jgi:Ca2+-binding RTX toxin-like protein